jgi:hypothetical protein
MVMVQFLLPPNRSLDVHAPIVVYRVVGRRLSHVYVNEQMQPSQSGTASQRLSECVYWRTAAVPGDQLQERAGGIVLVSASGHCHLVRLTAPTPIERDGAFTHADRAIRADCALINTLLTDRVIVIGAYRRPQGPPSLPLRRLLAEDHPLVSEKSPPHLAVQIGHPPRKVFQHWARKKRSAATVAAPRTIAG